MVIESPFLSSFGVSERKDLKSNEMVGYSLPVCLCNKDTNPTVEEHNFHKALINLTDICYQYLEDTYGLIS